jgi:hypothetical protein
MMHETRLQNKTPFSGDPGTLWHEKSFYEFFVYFQIRRKFRENKDIDRSSSFLRSVMERTFLQNFFAGGETFARGYSSIRVQPGMKLFRASQRNQN